MKSLLNFPPIRWASVHPRLSAWIVLSLGMIILMVITAQNIGLTAFNWVALILACIGVAGACIWIISWEESDDEDDALKASNSAAAPPKEG